MFIVTSFEITSPYNCIPYYYSSPGTLISAKQSTDEHCNQAMSSSFELGETVNYRMPCFYRTFCEYRFQINFLLTVIAVSWLGNLQRLVVLISECHCLFLKLYLMIVDGNEFLALMICTRRLFILACAGNQNRNTHTHTNAHKYARTHACTHKSIHTHTHTHKYTRKHAHTYTHTSARARTVKHIHSRTYICAHSRYNSKVNEWRCCV